MLWEKIIQNLNSLISLWGMGLMAGVVRMLLEPHSRGFVQIVVYMFVVSILCVCVGLFFIEKQIGLGLSFAGMFCTGFFAHTLLNYVMKNEEEYLSLFDQKLRDKVNDDE